jgi:hypothetical protein
MTPPKPRLIPSLAVAMIRLPVWNARLRKIARIVDAAKIIVDMVSVLAVDVLSVATVTPVAKGVVAHRYERWILRDFSQGWFIRLRGWQGGGRLIRRKCKAHFVVLINGKRMLSVLHISGRSNSLKYIIMIIGSVLHTLRC